MDAATSAGPQSASNTGNVAPVLVLGGTGAVGGIVVRELLARGVPVRVVVRDPKKLPEEVKSSPLLTVKHKELTAVTEDEMADLIKGCSAVVSCLGHRLTLKGVWFSGHFVLNSAKLVCETIERLEPSTPIKFIHLNTAACENPDGSDTHRGALERFFVTIVAWLLPPLMDSILTLYYLCQTIGLANRFVKWVIVRPDSFTDGDIGPYAIRLTLPASMFNPGETTRANAAHFMCDLAVNPAKWEKFQGTLPVILDYVPKSNSEKKNE